MTHNEIKESVKALLSSAYNVGYDDALKIRSGEFETKELAERFEKWRELRADIIIGFIKAMEF